MKKKISIMTLLAAMLLIFGASSAFAGSPIGNPDDDSASDPNVFYGVNDYFQGTLPSYSDIDYFHWHNDTGSDKSYYIYLYNVDDASLDYRVNSIAIGGSVPYPGVANLVFDQEGRECWSVFVPANADLDVTVRAQNILKVHPTSLYEIILMSTPPFP